MSFASARERTIYMTSVSSKYTAKVKRKIGSFMFSALLFKEMGQLRFSESMKKVMFGFTPPNAIDSLLTENFKVAVVLRSGDTATLESEIRLCPSDVFYEAGLENLEVDEQWF
jgi:hypothetical protein